MANATTPMFCLPFVLTGSNQVKVSFVETSEGGGAEEMEFTMATTSLYNNRDFTRSDNIWRDFVVKANAAEAAADWDAGTWSVAEQSSGTMKGMVTLTRTAGHANDNLSDIEFQTTAVLSGQDMGFQANTMAPSSEVVGTSAIWNTDYVTGRQWIPHPVYPGSFMAHHEKRPVDFIVGTDPNSTAATELTQDYYGGHNFRRIHIMTVNAASMLDQYAADSDFFEAGQATSDPNVTWDAFRRTWRDATGTLKQCRFHPDMDTAATYHSVLPLLPWIGSVEEGSTVAFEAPYRFDLDIEVLDV
jgi:hypothetical protein